MEVLEPVSQPPAISFHIDLARAQKTYLQDPMRYTKLAAATSLSSTNVLGLPRNHCSVQKRIKSAAVSPSYCQKKCNASTNSSVEVCVNSVASGSADLVNGISKLEKPIKRSSRKKGKRKGKQQRAPPSLCSTDGAVALDEVIYGTSVFESCSRKAASCGDQNILAGSFSASAKPCGISLEVSATPTTSASYSGEEDELETQASLSQGFSGDDFNQLRLSGRADNLIASERMIYAPDAILSNFDGEVADRYQKQSSIRDDSSSGIFSDEYCAPIMDSFSDCWNSDGSTHGGDDVDAQPCTRSGNGINFLGTKRVLGYSSSTSGTSLHDTRDSKEIFSCETSCNSANERPNGNSPPQSKAVDAHYTDRSRCSGRGCSSNDTLSIKRGRLGRKNFGSTTGLRRPCSGGNMHGRAGKEYSHSVWQKVQKDDIGECICDMKNTNDGCSPVTGSKEVHPCVRHDTVVCRRKNEHENSARSVCLNEIPAQTDMLERAASAFNSDVFSSKSECNELRNKDYEKLKRKPRLGSKEENHNSKKGPHSAKTNVTRSSKTNMQQKKALENLKPVIFNKNFSSSLRSPYADGQKVGISLTSRVNWRPSEPLQNTQIHLQEPKLPGPVCTVVSNMNAQAAQKLISPLSTTSDSSAPAHILKMHLEVGSKFRKDLPKVPCLPMGNEPNESAKLEIEFPHVENGKQDHFSGPISQKWVPVGRKDSVLDTCSKLSTNHLVGAAPDRWNLKNIEEDLLSSNSPILGPSTNAEVSCLGPNSLSLNLPSPVDEGQTENLGHHAPPIVGREHSSIHSAANCHSALEDKSRRISLFGTDANYMAQVVNDAYRLQIESEKVQLASGSPLAEFERLLHSASPVVAQAFGFKHCYTCRGDRLIGNSLCRHQIPNISLESIWQWYEGPGSYGLEVKAEDYCKSKRMGRDRFEFRAYFVPFLSAVQFFGHSRSSMCCSSDAKPNSELETTSNNSSNLDKIFSILLPRPHRPENPSVSPPVSSLRTSYSSVATDRDEICAQSSTGSCDDDSELLFEYFESEQPQHRRPLFEKIKELVRGSTISNGHIFGDPSKLDCLRLHDLHPSSWYSVAWYPIYRIPDGNFRAAFLTYHSLGHFIHRSSSLETLGGDSIVSPAVGLQSYNAQGECWFQQRNSVIQTEENPCFDSSEILRERLRTLEQTASVMARASIHKGDQKSINRQPDYEFFLSRRR
ncbi:Protein of unknown function DUF789 [Cinnamomum micranthum f. kanehirae]|uniref:Uncharacterized protein n=1 Tax=Cinnamomum micranthum f. kanehirae TaxID=337451 RepID=A0A443PI51_9MAGN|nr:Protein of unknown function DUF789 [Cinnamomum micranthum f. kanehirae]